MPIRDTHGERGGHATFRRAALLGWGVLVALYCALFALLWRGMQEQERGSERLIASVSNHVAQLAASTLEGIERSLIGLRQHLAQVRITHPDLEISLPTNLLHDVRSRHPELIDLRVVAVDGASWIDRDCESQGTLKRACIDAPFERDGIWRLPLRIPLDETHTQWIQADLNLRWLDLLATQQDLGDKGNLLVSHRSGAILAGSGGGPHAGTRHPPMNSNAAGEVVGKYRPRIISSEGGIDPSRSSVFRYSSTRMIGPYPLQVSAGSAHESALALWLPAALLVVLMSISGMVWWAALRLLARNYLQQRAFASELQQSSDALRQAQEIAQIGGWNIGGRPHEWHGSRELSALLGFADVITAEDLERVLEEEDLRQLKQRCTHPSIRHGGLDVEVRIRRPEGESGVLRIRAALQREGSDFVLRGTAQDITDPD
mgnify:CR=1 FL=1|jgi:PAS domain-containing protein